MQHGSDQSGKPPQPPPQQQQGGGAGAGGGDAGGNGKQFRSKRGNKGDGGDGGGAAAPGSGLSIPAPKTRVATQQGGGGGGGGKKGSGANTNSRGSTPPAGPGGNGKNRPTAAAATGGAKAGASVAAAAGAGAGASTTAAVAAAAASGSGKQQDGGSRERLTGSGAANRHRDRDHHREHRDPSVNAIAEASSSLAFPSNPPTIDDLTTPGAAGALAVGRQPGGPTAGAAAALMHRGVLDPGNAFPRSAFLTVGEITSGPLLRNHVSAVSAAATSTLLDRPAVASPKFAHYSALTQLEPEPRTSSLMPSHQTLVYRSSNRFSGSLVCIRRIVSCGSISAARCGAVSEYLRQFRHPNLVHLNSVVATSEFALGSQDVLLEYRYVKGGRSLSDIIASGEELTESCLWSIACQLVSLVRHFHESEVPLRGLHPTKLLLVQDVGDGSPSNCGGAQRIVFTGLGLVDVLGTTDVPPVASAMPQMLRADISAVGSILSQLIHSSLNVDKAANVQASPLFTPALFSLVRACGREGVTAVQLCRALGERLSLEYANALAHSDYVLAEFTREIQNGRLMKLLMRINFAVAASQAGYSDYDPMVIVRLFYQHLFAQIDDLGQPQYDWGLVYHGLNKLDVGSEDLVQLVSEQDHTLFIVSYKDVGRCIDVLCQGMVSSGGRGADGIVVATGGAGATGGGGAAAAAATAVSVGVGAAGTVMQDAVGAGAASALLAAAPGAGLVLPSGAVIPSHVVAAANALATGGPRAHSGATPVSAGPPSRMFGP